MMTVAITVVADMTPRTNPIPIPVISQFPVFRKYSEKNSPSANWEFVEHSV